jgi:pre-60S factor REI1
MTCRCMFSGNAEQREHYKSDWHRFNLKRKVAGLPAASRQAFEDQVAELNAERLAAEGTGERQQFTCAACQKKYSSKNAYNSHVSSKRHAQRVKQQRQKEEQEEEEQAVPDSASSTAAVDNGKGKSSSNNCVEEVKEHDDNDDDVVDDDDDADEKLPPKPLDQMSEKELIEWRYETAVKLNPDSDCLFCLERSGSLEQNMAHMATKHGLFVPDLEYLTDARGLIRYLGQKISVGLLCLWCNERSKNFQSLEAVRQHMRSKNHCKIAYELDDEEEFERFYDFSSSSLQVEADLKPAERVETETTSDAPAAASSSSIAAASSSTPSSVSDDDDVSLDDDKNSDAERYRRAARGNVDLSETGELVFANGKRVGHRDFMVFYKQRYPNEEPSRASIEIARMMDHYRHHGYVMSTENGDVHSRTARKIRQQQNKHAMQLSVKANKLQHHYRSQTGF